MTDNEKTMRICSSCKELDIFHIHMDMKLKLRNLTDYVEIVFFYKASPSDILKEVFGIDEETAEVLGEFSNQLEQNKERTENLENKVFSKKQPPKTIYDPRH